MSKEHQPLIDAHQARGRKDQELEDILTYIHDAFITPMHDAGKIREYQPLIKLSMALDRRRHRGCYVQHMREAKTFEELKVEGKEKGSLRLYTFLLDPEPMQPIPWIGA